VKAARVKKSAKSPAAAIPEGAKKAKLPVALSPQLATLVDEIPAGDGWIYELKLDGYRIVARIEGDDVRLFTRNGNDWTGRMKPLAEEARKLGIASAWLDGEVVVMNDKGVPEFQLLQNAFDSSKTAGIVYFVFDLPHFGGYDLTRVPLAQRRELLRQALGSDASPHIRFSEAFDVDPKELLESACRKGLEGLIGKRADAPYASTRSSSWVKLKCTRRQEFVVAGFTDPKGSRVGFGALLLGIHDEQGQLRYAGNVGTGFGDANLRELHAKLKALETDKDPFVDRPRSVKGHWVKPRLVAEVAFTEWTGDGRIRHPVFHGLRTDKGPQAITREVEKHVQTATAPGVKISHGERVVDPSTKATKLDIVNYYAGIAQHMLPHIAGRPVALVRAPTGIAGKLFFQKHTAKVKIPGIRQLDESFWPGHPAMIELEKPEALVAAAQVNVIEIHTWNSTVADIAHPDRVIFDMDPGEGVDWATTKEATALMKKMLDMLGLASFLKTSGGKGLHVVVPLTPHAQWGYDRVKDFSEAVVRHMARTIPRLFVAKSGPQNRVGRIFIDFLRNGEGATTVSAFSVRARPGLGVSVPVTWKELPGIESASQWTILNVHDRLKGLKRDPWENYGSTDQTLDAASKVLP
jgi:bifunctional non-homologous end joining protein LigD